MSDILVLNACTPVGLAVTARLLRTAGVGRVYAVDYADGSQWRRDLEEAVSDDAEVDTDALQVVGVDALTSLATRCRELAVEEASASPATVIACSPVAPEGEGVEGQRALVEEEREAIAELLRMAPQRAIHVLGSVLIGGRRDGVFTEYDTDCGQLLRTSREVSDYNRELTLRREFGESLTAVYRLPLITADAEYSRAGVVDGRWAAIRQALGGYRRRVIGDPDAILPVAGAEHVARVVAANVTASAPRTGTFHLCAGRISTAELAAAVKNERVDRKRYLSYSRYRAGIRARGMLGRAHTAPDENAEYLYWHSHYDDYRYGVLLDEHGIERGTAKPHIPTGVAMTPAVDDGRRRAIERRARGRLELSDASSVVVDGVRLEYWDIGRGDVVVLLGGLLGPETWSEVARGLAVRYRCIVCGVVGASGATAQQSKAWDAERQAAVVKGLLAKLDIRQRCTVVGADVAVPAVRHFRERWPELTGAVVYSNGATWRAAGRRLPTGLARVAMRRAWLRTLLWRLVRSGAVSGVGVTGLAKLLADAGQRGRRRLEAIERNLTQERQQFELACSQLVGGTEKDALDTGGKHGSSALNVALAWGGDNALGSLSENIRLMRESDNWIETLLLPDVGLDANEGYPEDYRRLIERCAHSYTEERPVSREPIRLAEAS